MAGNPLMQARVERATAERIDAEIKRTGEARADFLREGIELLLQARAAGRRPVDSTAARAVAPRKIERKYGFQPVTDKAPPTKAPKKPVRTTKCIHGQKPDQFCRRCDS